MQPRLPALRLLRVLARVFSAALAALAAGCACLSAPADLQSIQFSVYHPAAVVLYKPIAGTAPPDERAYLYLALQNDSAADVPICLACWNQSDGRWRWTPWHDVVPVVTVVAEGAPVVGQPQAVVTGLGGQSVRPLHRSPETLPDTGDFPLNEANYRRDVAIMIRPDRSNLARAGVLHVSVTLAHRDPSTGQASGTERGRTARFDVPVTFAPDFRPETPIPAISRLEAKP